MNTNVNGLTAYMEMVLDNRSELYTLDHKLWKLRVRR